MQVGFDNTLYIHKQKEHILERIAQFKGKLYLEFGGKLFDDYHAARVLPGLSLIHISVIGPPVSTAFAPRTRPSVLDMAMQRATLSPMCCATSSAVSYTHLDVYKRQESK